MKKLLFTIALLFYFSFINAQDVRLGKLSDTSLKQLKTHLATNFKIDLDSLSVLLIDYIQPRNYCHYNKYEKRKGSNISFQDYFKSINIILPKNSYHIHSYYKKTDIFKKKLDYFHDTDSIIHNIISAISSDKTCECFIATDKYGNLAIKYGEISTDEIREFLAFMAENLDKQNSRLN